MSQLEQLLWQQLWMEIPSFVPWNQSETVLSVNSSGANQGSQQVAMFWTHSIWWWVFLWRGKQAPKDYPDKDVWAMQHEKLCMMYFKCQQPVQSDTWNNASKLLMREKEADKLNGDSWQSCYRSASEFTSHILRSCIRVDLPEFTLSRYCWHCTPTPAVATELSQQCTVFYPNRLSITCKTCLPQWSILEQGKLPSLQKWR